MQTAKPKQPNTQLIAKFNELYIQTRRKYLVQFSNASYRTFDKERHSKIIALNDGMLANHLAGDITYGVFNGGYFNKFIALDVDFKDNALARWTTLKVIDVLVSEFHINRRDIHVSTSGNKGYHIELFFDEPIKAADVKAFYDRVMAQVGHVDGGEVEYRPSWTQGVKLPLGVHQKTGNRCWFVDNWTLKPIESYEYLLAIKPMPASAINAESFGLTERQAQEFEEVATSTNTSVNVLDQSDAIKKAARVLEAGRLVASNTRHNTTFMLACFFNSQGWEQGDAVEEIMNVLENTPRDYFSPDSTPQHWRNEAERLTGYVFTNDITLGNADKPIEIAKHEILVVLECGTFRQKQLAYAMLVTSKRYGQTFYLTTFTAMKMIGTKSRTTVHNAIKKLVDCGFIEYRRKGEIDKARTRETGRVYSKPNKYRLTIDQPPGDDDERVKVTKEHSLVDVVAMLLTDVEVRQFVKRTEYESRFKKAVEGGVTNK